MLAANIDHIYSNSQKDFDDRDMLEKRLSECASLFEFLTDKDSFIAFHTQYLSERLLVKKANTEEEKFFIGLLKISAGPQFTNQQETMIADLDKFTKSSEGGGSSAGDMNDFVNVFKDQYIKDAKRWKGDKFNIKCLTAACWPSVLNPPSIVIPECIHRAIKYHEQFYKSFEIHDSHRLMWSHMLGEFVRIWNVCCFCGFCGFCVYTTCPLSLLLLLTLD